MLFGFAVAQCLGRRLLSVTSCLRIYLNLGRTWFDAVDSFIAIFSLKKKPKKEKK